MSGPPPDEEGDAPDHAPPGVTEVTVATELVEVVEDERVAPHGQAHVWWFVQKADDYVKAGEWPGAVSERRDAGPGTVWERVIRFSVPRGTELMRVETRPRPAVRRDPLAYLEREQKGAPTVTRRSYFVVSRGGRLRLNPERRQK